MSNAVIDKSAVAGDAPRPGLKQPRLPKWAPIGLALISVGLGCGIGVAGDLSS